MTGRPIVTTYVDVVDKSKLGGLVFLVPTLSTGDYTLGVLTTICGSEDVRTDVLEATLTVA